MKKVMLLLTLVGSLSPFSIYSMDAAPGGTKDTQETRETRQTGSTGNTPHPEEDKAPVNIELRDAEAPIIPIMTRGYTRATNLQAARTTMLNPWQIACVVFSTASDLVDEISSGLCPGYEPDEDDHNHHS